MIPLPAASVLLLRGEPFEVLLLRRSEESTFVPGSWIFPGGALEPQDRAIAEGLGLGDEVSLMKICAIRETLEESGVWLGEALPIEVAEFRRQLLAGSEVPREYANAFAPALPRLVLTSRWVTPQGMPKRYDTFFFLAVVETETSATADAVEATDVLWITPDDALQRQKRRELPLLFPTIRNLDALRGFASSADLVEARREATIEIVRPVLLIEDGRKKIIIPGEQ